MGGNQPDSARLKRRAPYWGVQLIPSTPAAHLLMEIRHNLVVPEKPFFRRGCCVLKMAHHVWVSEYTLGFLGMKRWQIGLALAGTALCAVAFVMLWPQARDAAAMLAAQDDPAVLSDLQLNSVLRNNSAAIADNIEAALAAGDADLAAQLRRTRPGEEHRGDRRSVAAGERCRHRGKFHLADCKTLRDRPRDRKRRRCREPVGHRGRRSVRVRRHQGYRARGQASRHGRGHRSSGAGSCRRGPRGDGGDLCLGRRRGAGARRASLWSRTPARSGGSARG